MSEEKKVIISVVVVNASEEEQRIVQENIDMACEEISDHREYKKQRWEDFEVYLRTGKFPPEKLDSIDISQLKGWIESFNE